MNRLRRKHPVERISVLARQTPCAQRMLHGYREQKISGTCHSPNKVVRQNLRGRKLSQSKLGSDLPRRGSRNKQFVCRCPQQFTRAPRERVFVECRPQQCVRIQQNSQSPSPFHKQSSSSGKGSKNSGPTFPCPFRNPMRRLAGAGSIATKRATGLRSRPEVITTSSPWCARRTSSDRFVLASKMVAVCIVLPANLA